MAVLKISSLPSTDISKVEVLNTFVRVACAAHIRRKFYDALLNGKSKNSAIAIKYIQRMYFEENRLREKNLSDSEFIEKRKEIIKPIMDEF